MPARVPHPLLLQQVPVTTTQAGAPRHRACPSGAAATPLLNESGVHTHTSIHVSPFTTAFQQELARIFKQAKNQNHSTCGPSAISLVQTPQGQHCTTTSSALALMTCQGSGPVVRQGQEDPSHRPQSPPPSPWAVTQQSRPRPGIWTQARPETVS